MNSPLSLVQELRSIRGGQKHTQNEGDALLAEIREARREWQAQVEQGQQILRDLLRAMSELTGVNLPEAAIDPRKPDEALLRLDFKTLKDRIRNDLESFSRSAAVEMGKDAHGKGAVALDGLQQEIDNRLNNLAEEFRTKLQARLESEQAQIAEQGKTQLNHQMQAMMDEFAAWTKLMSEGVESSLPMKIEKSLEPHVKEATAKFVSSFRQELQFMFHEQEQNSHNKIQELGEQFQKQINSLGEEAQQFCKQNAETTIKAFTEHFNAVAAEAAKKSEAKVETDIEQHVNNLRQRLNEVQAASQAGVQAHADLQVENFKQKLQELAGTLQERSTAEISANVGRITEGAVQSSLQQLRQQLGDATEHSKGELTASMQSMLDDAQKQMRDLAQSTRESLSKDATGFADSLRNLGDGLKSTEQEYVTASEKRFSALSQTALEALAANVKKVADAQIEEIRKALGEFQVKAASEYELRLREAMDGQHNAMLARVHKESEEAAAQAAARIKASSDRVVQELSETVNKEVNTSTALLKEWALHTTTWAESSIKNSLDSYKSQLTQFTEGILDEQRKSINSGISDLQGRLEQAARLLQGASAEESASAIGPRRVRPA